MHFDGDDTEDLTWAAEKDLCKKQFGVLPENDHELLCEFRESLLVGRLSVTSVTETADAFITWRPPQTDTLMVLQFISASLWGCFSCECFVCTEDGW